VASAKTGNPRAATRTSINEERHVTEEFTPNVNDIIETWR